MTARTQTRPRVARRPALRARCTEPARSVSRGTNRSEDR
jgi:hypothetical protein